MENVGTSTEADEFWEWDGMPSEGNQLWDWEDIIGAHNNPEYDKDSLDEDDARFQIPAIVEIEMLLMQMCVLVAECHDYAENQKTKLPIPQRTSKLKGLAWIHWVLTNPNPTTCYERFRMFPDTFLKLCNTLKQNGFLRSSRYVKITEQVAAFLLVAAQRFQQRSVADRLQRSTETVSKYVRRVNIALCKLGQTIIRPCATQIPHPYIENNERYNPWFSKCIGAIDGTHIDAAVIGENSVPYRGRKLKTTQNVMCVTDFDLCFTYVYAGWEGSAHDSRIFMECINDPTVLFPTPIEDYFYLVDSGYACFKGFLPPYKNERYHLENFRGNFSGPGTPNELFNYTHSSLRSTVERSFGILKNRFPILNLMPSYPIQLQPYFIIACCTVHNFIRNDCGDRDPLFKEALHEMYGATWVDISQREAMLVVPRVAPGQRPDQSKSSAWRMELYRDAMRDSIWETFNEL